MKTDKGKVATGKWKRWLCVGCALTSFIIALVCVAQTHPPPCTGPCCGSTDPCCGSTDPCCGKGPCCPIQAEIASLSAQLGAAQNDEATQQGIMTAALPHITQLNIDIGQLQLQRAPLITQRNQNNALIIQLQQAQAAGEAIGNSAALLAIATAQGWLDLVVVLIDETSDAQLNALLGEGLNALCGSIGGLIVTEQGAIDNLNGDIAADNLSLGVWNGVYNNALSQYGNDAAQIASLMNQLTPLEAECGG
jgi:hypothetical protein